MNRTYDMKIGIGDIVQANPKTFERGPCLVVVAEIKPWGIQGYTSTPSGNGDAYIRLPWADIEPTEDKAVWIAA